MATITASQVNELRQKTGLGMMECKKALVATDGDMDAAIEHLRKAGLAKAEKKVGRAASNGKFFTQQEGNAGVLVELLCETDFVAKTDNFKAFGKKLAASALADFTDNGDISEKMAAKYQDELKALIAQIGENMHIRRVIRWTTNGKIGVYLHTGVPYGVMVDAEGDVNDELLMDICMHITAYNPQYITPADVPQAVLDKEREIAAAQMAGKPAAMIDKIVMGKLNKWYTEVCLSKQAWINDDKTTLEKLAPKAKVVRFVRWQVGEEL